MMDLAIVVLGSEADNWGERPGFHLVEPLLGGLVRTGFGLAWITVCPGLHRIRLLPESVR